ncbi:MAG: KilA-N domain-containing protein [Patescibacteria group bacterium]
MNKPKIIVKNVAISLISKGGSDYLSLTDMAKSKNSEFPADVVKNWLKTRFTIDFMGIWEQIYNPNFNLVEFDQFKKNAGVNSFVLSPEKWIKSTNAIGIRSKSGRYGGGTFAHKDIAFEFASWISPEFKLYLIKEFQRLKEQENERLELGWDLKRALTKINYRIHTDAIQTHLIPSRLSKKEINIVYANEADVLNVALFGKTAKEWRDENPKNEGNIRDYADVTQLVVLANLEGINAELIKQEISQSQRLLNLNQIAISQMQSLIGNATIKKLKNKL